MFGSHVGDVEDSRFLGCDTVWSAKSHRRYYVLTPVVSVVAVEYINFNLRFYDFQLVPRHLTFEDTVTDNYVHAPTAVVIRY
jgi:hypothetical protein